MEKTQKILDLELICCEVRRRMFTTILNAGSGHIGGSSSSLELMVSLYFGGILKFDPENPRHPGRDRVLVRGHLGPLRYSIFSLLGWVTESELSTYRSLGSRLQGHESMDCVPGVDITPSGSLGMVLSYGAGCAFALRTQKLSSMVYVFIGDGEEQEGNISEAARHISHLKLGNVVCLLDRNLKQLSKPTEKVDSGANLIKIWEGYGWDIKEIKNGHSIGEIVGVLQESRQPGKPTLIIANTIKGCGVKGSEYHFSGYHTITTCPKEYIAEAINGLEKQVEILQSDSRWLDCAIKSRIEQIPRPELKPLADYQTSVIDINPDPTDDFDDAFISYSRSLVSLFENMQQLRLYVMTADWISEVPFRESHFDKEHINFIDVGIHEQHLLAMAHGISVSDPNSRIMIIDGDFLIYRASDQLQAISQAKSKMIIVGTDSGICEGRNGSTHQSTGQSGMLISMPGLHMLEPGDSVDLYNCLNWAFTKYSGPVYVRLHSGSVEKFPIEKRSISSYVAYQPLNQCKLILVGSGLPLGQMIKVAKKYDTTGGIGIRVINVIDMEHLDRSFTELIEGGVPILTIYNGNPLILQSAVARIILEYEKPRPSIIRGHGFTLGTTGRVSDLYRYFRLDQEGIEKIIMETFSHFEP